MATAAKKTRTFARVTKGPGFVDVRLSLLVALYRDGGQWVAHALELDLVTFAPTVEAAKERLLKSIEFWVDDAVKHDTFDQMMRPAPPEIWQRCMSALAHGAHTETRPYRELNPESKYPGAIDALRFVPLEAR